MKMKTTKYTKEQVLAVVAKAKELAKAESEKMFGIRGNYAACGFAWVDIAGVRSNSNLGKWLIEAGFDKSWRPGVLQLWNPSGLGVQSVDILSGGAQVAAQYIRTELGLDCYSDSRLD
jgi:hypothetical protein